MTARIVLPAGLHDIPAEVYHADPCERPSLSSTLARKILQSPLHAWTASSRLNPGYVSNETEALKFGRVAHAALLGRGGGFAVCPPELLSSDGAIRTNAAKAWAAEQADAGLTVINGKQAAALEQMVPIAHRRLAAFGIAIDPAESEMVAIADIDGVTCRAMLDNLPSKPIRGVGRAIIDYKTCEDASPDACLRAVTGYGYDVQAEHYRQVYRAATGEDRAFLFVFQEKTAPFEVSVVELHRSAAADDLSDWSAGAASKCAEARRLWGECLSTGIWPGYPSQIAVIGQPAWHRQKWDDRSVGATTSPETIAAATRWQAPEAAA